MQMERKHEARDCRNKFWRKYVSTRPPHRCKQFRQHVAQDVVASRYEAGAQTGDGMETVRVGCCSTVGAGVGARTKWYAENPAQCCAEFHWRKCPDEGGEG